MNLCICIGDSFLKAYYNQGTVLDAQDEALNGKTKVSILWNIDAMEETDIKVHTT